MCPADLRCAASSSSRLVQRPSPKTAPTSRTTDFPPPSQTRIPYRTQCKSAAMVHFPKKQCMKKSALFFHVSDVCMLRLDFETFTTVGTNGSANDNEGDCVDQFAVTVNKDYTH